MAAPQECQCGFCTNSQLAAKRSDCIVRLRKVGSAVVAFSAGADSTLLLALAAEAMGPTNVLAAMGVSPSLPQRERLEGRALAARLGVELAEITTDELADARYAANPANRCYYCKHELFSRLARLAQARGLRAVLSGANADDTGDFRPGLEAGRELGVRNPLMEAGLSKAEVRELSRAMGLPTWDKPAMACLASRVPYDSPITADRLGRIERAENWLRDAGLRQVRVRDHGPVARIEVPLDDQPLLLAIRPQLLDHFRVLGYVYVTMDLAGFRSGSSNEVLGPPGPLPPAVAQPFQAVQGEPEAQAGKPVPPPQRYWP